MGWILVGLLGLAGVSFAECPAPLFKKGVDLAENGRSKEALEVFRQVTEKDSTCLEGWNNRASLEAATGDMFASQRSLSRALGVRRDVQSVATNLEKLRSRMARMAYDSAFGTPSKLPPLKLELHKELSRAPRAKSSVDSDSLVRALSRARQEISELTRVRDSLLTSGRVAQLNTSGESARSESIVVPPPPPPPEPKPSQPADLKPPAQAVDAPAPRKAPIESEKSASPQVQALAVLQAWAAAWSAQNVDGYLGFYGTAFEVPDKLARKAWEAKRRERILAPKAIHVEIGSPEAKVLGPGKVEIVYKQVYQTDEVRLVLRKRIVLTKEGKEWKIVSEREAR